MCIRKFTYGFCCILSCAYVHNNNNNNESLHHKQGKTLHDCNVSIYNWSLHVNAGRAVRRHRVLALCWAQGFVVHSLNIIIINTLYSTTTTTTCELHVLLQRNYLPLYSSSSSSNDNHKFRLYNNIYYICMCVSKKSAYKI